MTQKKRISHKKNNEVNLKVGLGARKVALEIVDSVLHQKISLDECLKNSYSRESNNGSILFDYRDRNFTRLLATTMLRRHGQLTKIVSNYLKKPLPNSGQYAQLILLLGAAQLIFLKGTPHSVIDTAVELCRMQHSSMRFAGLINAVLRRISERDPAHLLEQTNDFLNVPKWMLNRWITAYDKKTTREIVTASLKEAALDITVLGKSQELANRVNGIVLPTGSVRCYGCGRINELPGYTDGQWLIQDAAAALPARLLGKIAGRRVADICAAPGGKTAQLVSSNAHVTAIDISEKKLLRVRENLKRLRLSAASYIVADAAKWSSKTMFDAILLDAPCSATGTIRRHPDILHIKKLQDIDKLSRIQKAILENVALKLLRPNGILIYCTCSLEPEEGEEQIETFLKSYKEFNRVPIYANEIAGLDECLTLKGDVRILPYHLQLSNPKLSGLDGFFISRLRKRGHYSS